MLPEQSAVLTAELRSLLNRASGQTQSDTAPEFLSGNPLSPLWFVGINAAGGGSRPTWDTARTHPDAYLDYYLGRYGGLSFVARPATDRRGLDVSRSAWSYMQYVQAFAAGLGQPQDASSLLFKTNRYGAQTKRAEELRKLADPVDLTETFEHMVAAFAPRVIVAFAAEPCALVQRLGFCLEYPTMADIMAWNGTEPLRIIFPKTPVHIFSAERAVLMRAVGQRLRQ